ncbi:hypothetical protein BGZ74_004620 [Mortierella antarctica]|nr:hypothetical protein BGZ74_004620 [Mortierella antarctica]
MDQLKNSCPEIKVEHGADSGDLKTVYGPSIAGLEVSYSTTYNGFDDARENTATFFYVLDQLCGFYSSNQFKNMSYGFQCAKRAEMDRAAARALKLVSKDNGLFVYGNAQFNTHTNLSTLHGSFKNFFADKAMSLGYEVVMADEFWTSTKCPPCTAKGKDVHMAKPSSRTCVCLEESCQYYTDRDSVGSHNLALIGQQHLIDQTRPVALRRPVATQQV